MLIGWEKMFPILWRSPTDQVSSKDTQWFLKKLEQNVQEHKKVKADNENQIKAIAAVNE